VLGLVVLLSVIVAGAIYAGPLGQGADDAEEVPFPDHLGEIFKEQEDDDQILATVNGHDFSKGHVRVGYHSHMLTEPHLTEEEAIKELILSKFDSVLLTSIAKARELEVTEEELRAIADRNRAGCEINEQVEAECRENMAAMGIDYDIHWEDIIPTLQANYTELKAMDALREEYLQSKETDAEGETLDWLVIHELRENADIVWHDEDIQELFDQAHAERGEHLRRVDIQLFEAISHLTRFRTSAVGPYDR